MYILEISFSDHDSFYEISREDFEKVMAEPNLLKRDSMVVELSKPTSVHSTADADIGIVIDSQPAEERWADVEEAWEELRDLPDDWR